MMAPENLDAAAAMLADCRLRRQPLDALPAALRPPSEADAYEIQHRLHGRLTAGGLGPVVGHKIGCTTAVMQAFLKIPNPCAGGVFSRTVHRSPARVAHDGFVRVGVECEIVARLKRDLPPRAAPYEFAEVAAAVGTVMPGMEIVDARYVDYTRLDTPTLIADDFFDAGCVLGLADDFFDAGCVLGPETPWDGTLALEAVQGVTRINGTEVGRGRGADVMGHPFHALRWLANQRAARGEGLSAGEFVFLGSVVETKWVALGDHVVMELDGLGTIEAVFD